MGQFASVSTANPNSGGVYFLAGNYLVDITANKSIRSRKGEDMYVIEAVIVDSDHPARTPGTQASQIISMKHDSAPGNIRAYLAAAMNVSFEEIGEDEAEYSVSEANPLRGTRMRLSCVITKTRAGGDYTVHKWSFVSAATSETKNAADARVAAKTGALAAGATSDVRPAPPPAVLPPPPPPPPPAAGDWQPHPTTPGALWSPSTGQTRWA